MSEKLNKAKALGAKFEIGIEGEDKVLYVKDVDKVLYDMFFDTYEKDPKSAKESLLRSLVIKEVSDMEILEDPRYLYSACNQLFAILDLKKSTLKKL
jgi:hypothetical protein